LALPTVLSSEAFDVISVLSHYIIINNHKLCGSFWRRDVMKLLDKYRMVTEFTIKARDTAMFWADKWMPHKSFLRLFSFEIDQTLSVKEVLLLTDKTELFHMPLSQQAHEELDQL
jgi:hypothetical protein